MRVYNIHSFPDGALEYISKVMGNNLTGTEIADLLKLVGYSERSNIVGTKWRFIYDLFKNINKEKLGPSQIIQIIEVFCDPTRWIGRGPQHKNVVAQINEALLFVDLQINTEGNVTTINEKSKFEEKTKVEDASDSQEMIVKPIFRARNIALEENFCFVLMPFQPSSNRLYKEKIKPTVWSCGFRCARADEFFSPTSIPEDIWSQICKSKVIIADVTGKNPNVFYEIGIAHAVGKSVIFITQNKTDIPFDVAHYRYILYSDDANGWNKLCSNIRSALTGFITRKKK